MLQKPFAGLSLRRIVPAIMLLLVLAVCGLSGWVLSTGAVHYEGPMNWYVTLGAVIVGIMEDDFCRDGYDHYSLAAIVEWPGQAQPFFAAWPIQRKTKCS